MSAVTGGQAQRAASAAVKPPLGVPRRLLRMRSDAALAERFAAGDELAFDVIYERHRPVVLAVSMGVLGTTQDAEDATQETFSALAFALRSKPPVELRPWLISVARNASIDTTRRRRHRLLTLDGEIPDVPRANRRRPGRAGHGARRHPRAARGPADGAADARTRRTHLPEIAEFLETDEEAVKGLIARARVGLRTYREATELPCTTARSTIAAEPDGRRYDKTIRRHLRSCPSCRSYRAALRTMQRHYVPPCRCLPAPSPPAASRAAHSPRQGRGCSATDSRKRPHTCAASVCAVGAVGGMVLVTPMHKLGLPLIGPARSTPAPAHVASRPADKHTVLLRHPAATGSGAAAATVKQAGKAAPTRHATRSRHATAGVTVSRRHHHRSMTVTRVKLPNLPAAALTGTAQPPVPALSAGAVTPVTQSSTPAVTSTTPNQTPTPQGTVTTGSGTQPGASQGTQSTGSAGYGATWVSGNPLGPSSGSSGSQSQSGDGTFNGNSTTSVVVGGGSQGGYGDGATTTPTDTTPTGTDTSTSTTTTPTDTTTSTSTTITATSTTDTTLTEADTSTSTTPTPTFSTAFASSSQTTTTPSRSWHEGRGH